MNEEQALDMCKEAMNEMAKAMFASIRDRAPHLKSLSGDVAAEVLANAFENAIDSLILGD